MERRRRERIVLGCDAGSDVIVQGGTILVVDDDQLVRDSVGRILEAEGYAVRFASDGAEALAEVRRAAPDAILLDVMMPNMNGREFLRTLRDGATGSTIPVVVMTAVPGIDTNRVFTLGATDLVEKPFDIEVLLNKVALAMFRSHNLVSPGEDRGPASDEGPTVSDPRDDAAEGVIVAIASPSDTLEALDRMLNEHGCTLVSMARVTEELTRLTSVLDPAAILLDVDVDGGRGLAGLAALRGTRGLGDVPILVFASESDIDAHAEELSGFSAHTTGGAPSAGDLFSFVSDGCSICGSPNTD